MSKISAYPEYFLELFQESPLHQALDDLPDNHPAVDALFEAIYKPIKSSGKKRLLCLGQTGLAALAIAQALCTGVAPMDPIPSFAGEVLAHKD